MQQARRAGAMRHLDGRDGLLTRPDALEPVAVVVAAPVEVHALRPDLGLEDTRITRRQGLGVLELRLRIARRHGLVAARYEDPALGALEADAVRTVVADDHVHAACVASLGAERAVNVPQASRRELGGSPDLDWPGVFGGHVPVRPFNLV